MSIFKKLYLWMLSWSDKPSGPVALGIFSFSEAIFFPIPPDTLLIPLALGKREKALYFAFICSICSILGGTLAYTLGAWLWWEDLNLYSNFAKFFFDHIPGFTPAAFDRVKQLYDKYNFMIIFTAGFTPIPFKLFTISAGSFKINFPLFILASTLSRSARFFIVAFLIKLYGDPINYFIDKYFNIIAIVFTILLFGGFALLNFILI